MLVSVTAFFRVNRREGAQVTKYYDPVNELKVVHTHAQLYDENVKPVP